MAAYRIYRLKETQRNHFRWAPHTSGATVVKPRDYEQTGSVEAPTVYAAWSRLRETQEALKVGDLLQEEQGDLCICKYVGFEQARWVLPETEPGRESERPASGMPCDTAEGSASLSG